MIAGRPAADFPTEEHSPAQELAPHQHAPLPASYSELRVLDETLGAIDGRPLFGDRLPFPPPLVPLAIRQCDEFARSAGLLVHHVDWVGHRPTGSACAGGHATAAMVATGAYLAPFRHRDALSP